MSLKRKLWPWSHPVLPVTQVTLSPPAPILKGIAGQDDRALVFRTGHKWLGLYWSASLDLSVALRTRLAIAQKAFALLAGLAQRDALPHTWCRRFFGVKFSLRYVLARGCWVLRQMHSTFWILPYSPGQSSFLEAANSECSYSLIGVGLGHVRVFHCGLACGTA